MPFTIILLIALIIVGVWTKTHRSVLSQHWIERVGFAPNDLWVGRFERLIFSSFFTDSRKSFIQALVMTVIAVGGAEKVGGTFRTILLFWGVHVVTLVILSLLIVLPLHKLSIPFGTELALVRDVGPSAGYFGCLGFLILYLPVRWRWWLGGVVLIGLFIVLSMPSRIDKNSLVKKHADLAHIIAFILGVLSGVVRSLKILL